MNKLSNLLKNLFDSLPLQEKINFVRHLSLTVKAGLPVFKGLQLIKKQTNSRTLKKIIDQVNKDVGEGHFLADSLSKYKHVFGDFFVSIIRVGESSGTLAANLNYLAEELEKSQDLRSKIKSALVYPIIVFVATLGIVAFLVFFIFPKILPVFANLKAQLPAPTRILIGFSDFITTHGLETLAGIIVLIIVFRILLRFVTPFRYFLHRMMLWTPVLGKMSISVNSANFTRVLGLLLKSGMPIVEALNITSNTLENLVYRREIKYSAEAIGKGSQLAVHLAKKSSVFPILLTGMIEIGENTGNLEENLAYLAEFYTKETDVRLRNLTSILEPMMLLFMGGMVGFVALSIITPIYQLSVSVG